MDVGRGGKTALVTGGDFLTTPDEEWMNGWSLKLLGYIRMAREVLPDMQRQGSGRIINVVGAAARNPAVTYMMGGCGERRAHQLHQGPV